MSDAFSSPLPVATPGLEARTDVAGRATERALANGSVVVCWARGRLGPSTPPELTYGSGASRDRAWGRAWSVALDGAGRFGRLRGALAELWSRLEAIGEPAPCAPRVYGGLAFSVGAASAAPWGAFGDGRFTLPRWIEITDDAGRPWTAFAIDGSALARASAPAVVAPPRAAADLQPRTDGARAAFIRAVENVRRDIARGEVEKVVVARRAVIDLGGDLSAADVIERLADRFSDCTAFAFEAGGATFLGATPERLFEKRGARVRTEALAGSIDPSVADAGARLLASAKDRAEHAFVVRDIERRLAPLCVELSVASAPELRALPHVLHMRTPIEGSLREGISAVDLLEQLHPTPAVGGVPAAAALARILALEPEPRGWYGAPVGFIDARGDASFSVALRSGVVAGGLAYLYAGAGIVAASDPESEWSETALKMRALEDALLQKGHVPTQRRRAGRP